MDGNDVFKIIAPKLADQDGTLYLTSTITHHNWLWDLYLRGQDPREKLVKSWLYPTSTGIMFQGEKGRQRLEDLKSVTDFKTWQSEYECIPSSDDTSAFPFINDCLDGVDNIAPNKGGPFIMGLDLGRSIDSTVMVIIHVPTGTVCHTHRFAKGSRHETMALAVGAETKRWGNCSVVIDSTGGGGSGGAKTSDDSYVNFYRPHITELHKFVWSPNRENAAKKDLIDALCLAFETAKLHINKDKFQELIAELRNYRVFVERSGQVTFGPRTGHDDYVSALAMAWWGIKQHWYNTNNPSGWVPSF